MKTTIKITLIYLVFGIAWIIISDELLLYILDDSELYYRNSFQLAKGIFYVIFTAVLLYFLISRYRSKLEKKVQELKTLNQKLGEEQSNTQKINAQLEYFADSASHDLKSPLRTISLLVDRFGRKFSDNLPNEAKEYLEIIKDSSKELMIKIDSSLRFSKIHDLNEAFEIINTTEVVRKVIGDMERDIAEKDAHLEIENLPDIISSKQLIYQIFQNLIDNAVKYSKKNMKPEIKIGHINDDNDYWTFFVKDNGVGIKDSDQCKVFDRYHRSDKDSENGGNGIGLYTVSQIITRLKGKLWMESELNKGTKMYFSIPK